jgi:hypothetical protein
MAHTEMGIAVESFAREEVKRRGIDANVSVRESRDNLAFSVHLQVPGTGVADLDLPRGYENGLDGWTQGAIKGWLDQIR